MRIDSFFDSEPFWVIWQVSRAPGGNRIRRISQDFKTEARAIAEAERFRQSGAITWIEEARPLAPARIPPEALAVLRETPAATHEDVSRLAARLPNRPPASPSRNNPATCRPTG